MMPAEIVTKARLLSSTLQRMYPVDTDRFRKARLVLEGIISMPESPVPRFGGEEPLLGRDDNLQVANHKSAVTAIFNYLSGAVARDAYKKAADGAAINREDLGAFLNYLQERFSREDFPFYRTPLSGYLAETRNDFAPQAALLFANTPHASAHTFLLEFRRQLRLVLEGIINMPETSVEHHLNHAGMALLSIFEKDVLYLMRGRLTDEQIGEIFLAGQGKQLFLCLTRTEDYGNSGRISGLSYYARFSETRPDGPNLLARLVQVDSKLPRENTLSLGSIDITINRLPRVGEITGLSYGFCGIGEETAAQLRFKRVIAEMVLQDVDDRVLKKKYWLDGEGATQEFFRAAVEKMVLQDVGDIILEKKPAAKAY